MTEFKIKMQKYPLLTAVITLILCFGIMRLSFWKFFPETTALILERIVTTAIVLTLIAFITGRQAVSYSNKGMGYAFAAFSGYLLIFLFISAIPITVSILNKTPLSSGVVFLFIRDALLFLLVGLFEEGLFRGLIFNALLAHWGTRRSGVVWAVIVSALFFGFIHVYREFFTLEILDPLVLTNALLKILQVALLGFPLAVIYLRTENLWAVAILHGLFDFLSDLYSILYENGVVLLDSYALGGEEGFYAVIGYLFVIVLFLIPTVFVARQLRKIPLPQRGFFREIWKPKNVQ